METEAQADPQIEKKRLDDWFDNKFLTIYQNTTNVEKARRELHRYQPPQEVLEKIYEFVLADNRRRHIAKQRNEFYAPACNCYTFFHESRWMDKIPATSDRNVERVLLKCSCGTEAKHLYPFQGKHYCLKCYDDKAHPDFKRKVYEQLCKVGLGKTHEETREQWRERIRLQGLKVIEKHFGKKSNPKLH